MSLHSFLKICGYGCFEGFSQEVPEQVADLIEIIGKSKINVMEIGFNAGHSAEVFLKNNPEMTLISFDIGTHEYVIRGKEYIDTTYPNRHTLILGDSTKTVPEFVDNNKDTKFDVIFIDGGHTYEVANSDMTYCMKLAHKDTIVILDDTMYTKEWEQHYTIGPTKVWKEFIEAGKLKEITHKDYLNGRGMSWGKYII